MNSYDDETVLPCTTVSPDTFFPARTDRASFDKAVALCSGCPKRVSCYEFAVSTREPDGIWGGRKFGEPMRRPKLRTEYDPIDLDADGWPIGLPRTRFTATKCRAGHEYTRENTIWGTHNDDIARRCRICAKAKKQRSSPALLAA